MSVYIKRPNGQKQKIAGHTILLDANVSEMRSGEVDFPALAVDGYSVIDIVFEDPMPDADYQVFLGDFTNMREYSIVGRTATGCRAYLTRPAAYGVGTAGTMKYLVFKPIKLEGYTELQNRIMNPDNVPTENSENLVKSGGVWEAIKNASSVFVGTEAGWEAADHTKWDIAVLTDKHMILSVNRTSGESAEQANLDKVFDGTQAEWDALTDEQRDYYDHAMIKNKSVATSILEKIYSVGALYFNTADVDPAEIFGFGTWERVAKNMALWGASADGQGGTTKAAGLPNITGDGLNTELSWNDPQADGYGCFRSIKGPDADRYRPIGGDKTCCYRYYSLDASRSNPIYGASTTVQPPAFIVNIWRRTA